MYLDELRPYSVTLRGKASHCPGLIPASQPLESAQPFPLGVRNSEELTGERKPINLLSLSKSLPSSSLYIPNHQPGFCADQFLFFSFPYFSR